MWQKKRTKENVSQVLWRVTLQQKWIISQSVLPTKSHSFLSFLNTKLWCIFFSMPHQRKKPASELRSKKHKGKTLHTATCEPGLRLLQLNDSVPETKIVSSDAKIILSPSFAFFSTVRGNYTQFRGTFAKIHSSLVLNFTSTRDSKIRLGQYLVRNWYINSASSLAAEKMKGQGHSYLTTDPSWDFFL